MTSPWPDELQRIEGSRRYLIPRVGMHSLDLLGIAETRGYLSAPNGITVQIDVRCTYQEKAAYQHHRDAWHYDTALLGWIWVEGPGPTEIRDDEGRVSSIPTGEFVPYHRVEHRCPPQPQAGWRYFMRILWIEGHCLNRVTP